MIRFLRRQARATLDVLASLRGNARAVVVTEWLFSAPYSLVQTYAAVYMLAVGCTATQVGLVGTLGFAVQMVVSLAGGWVTDRLGRKRATLVFDLVSWTIPMVLWALARGFPWFVVAAIVNGFVRIVHISWTCLFVEDTTPDRRVHVYTWVALAGVLAGLLTPVGGALVGRFGLVPAMRGMYLGAGAVMTAMFLVRNLMLHETSIGHQRMQETRHHRLADTAAEYGRVALHLLRDRRAVVALLLVVVSSIVSYLRSTFLPVVLVHGLGFPEAAVAAFPAVTSAVMFVVFVFVMPQIVRRGAALPLAAGFAVLAAGTGLLAASPGHSLPAAIAATVLGGLGQAIAYPLADTMIANALPERDRALATSICWLIMFGASSPFGWIAGRLAEISPRLPFVLATAVCLAGAGLAIAAARGERWKA